MLFRRVMLSLSVMLSDCGWKLSGFCLFQEFHINLSIQHKYNSLLGLSELKEMRQIGTTTAALKYLLFM